MLKTKNECFVVEWRLVGASRINCENGFETIEEAQKCLAKIKQSYPVAFGCIGKARKL